MNKVPEVPKTKPHEQRIHIQGRREGVLSSLVLDGALMTLRSLLLVEDSARMRIAIGRIVGERFGSVHWVDDGGQALSKAAQVMPDTILLDISLPGVSGLILLPQLRKSHPRARIVVLTSHPDDRYRKEAFARGADAYVLKNHADLDLVPAMLAGTRDSTPPTFSMAAPLAE